MLVEISGDKLIFPPSCACCGGQSQTGLVATATRVTGVRVVRTSSKTWQFPYCHRCLRHVSEVQSSIERLNSIQSGGCGLAVLTFILAVIVGFSSSSFPLFLLIATLTTTATVVICTILRNGERERLEQVLPGLMSGSCTCPDSAVSYLGWYGRCHSFEVQSEQYAFAFMRANLQKLTNVDPATWNRLHDGQPPVVQQQARKFTS